MATPHVSVLTAVVWLAKTSATNAEVHVALIASAKDLGALGRDTNSYGHELVKAKQAIEFLLGLCTSRPTSEPSACPSCVGVVIDVKILTDWYPAETTWTLSVTRTAISGNSYDLQNTTATFLILPQVRVRLVIQLCQSRPMEILVIANVEVLHGDLKWGRR